MTRTLVILIAALLAAVIPVFGQTAATTDGAAAVNATNAVSTAVAGIQLQGAWKKVQAQPLLAMGRISFDMTARTLSFGWQGKGDLSWEIVSVKADNDADMPRFTLGLSGAAGKMTITVLCFSENTIYVGQSPVGGISIWGAYNRAD